MKTIYGHFDDNQIEEYKVKLHRELFWLLLYKDPKLEYKYNNINYDKFFTFLMKRLDGLNEILDYPVELVQIMSSLQAAFNEAHKDEFNYKMYRKLILDAHSLVDKINKRGG